MVTDCGFLLVLWRLASAGGQVYLQRSWVARHDDHSRHSIKGSYQGSCEVQQSENTWKLKWSQKARNWIRCHRQTRRSNLKWSVQEARMALRLETFMLECRSNMPAKYNRDLKYRFCLPAGKSDPDSIAKQPDEDQEHLECCSGLSLSLKYWGSNSIINSSIWN